MEERNMAPIKKTNQTENTKKSMSKGKKKMFQYKIESLTTALHQIRENKMKIREASRMYGVPKTTLIDRLSGRVPEKLRLPGPQPLLGVEGEKKIKDWVINIAKCGFPINKNMLLDTVAQIDKDSGRNLFKGKRPGQTWYLSFLKRNPEISRREAESVNKARAIVSKEFIQKWFKDLQQYLEEQNMMDIFEDPNRIFNGDESGFFLCPKSEKVLGPRGFKNVYSVKLSNEKEIITVLIFFNANGNIALPLAIFPYIRPPRSLINNLPNNGIVGKSEKGWMTSDVFYEYIANDFHTWVLENQIKKPLLIFVDGHKSHMTLSLSEWCDKNQIVLYALPPNTTHILQPADVALFKPMKQEWKNTVKNWHSVTKFNFCTIFNAALSKKSELANNIRNGFRKCGLCPLNEEAVDYSKCILNTTEKLTKPGNRNSSEYCSKQDFRAAAKVINNIKDNLTRYGINVNVILNEITHLEESTPKRRSSEKHQSRGENSIEHHSLAQPPLLESTNNSHDTNYLESIENAEVVFDFPDINDPPLLTPETTINIINDIPDVTLGSTFTQSFIDGIMVIDAKNSEIVDREKICHIGQPQLLQISDGEKEGNCESISNAEYRDLIVDKENNANYNNNGKRNTECNIADNSGETINHKTSVIDRNNTSSSLPDSVFDKHLIYPLTLTQRNRNTTNTREKAPSAISSVKWREYYSRKDEEKELKEVEKERRKRARDDKKKQKEIDKDKKKEATQKAQQQKKITAKVKGNKSHIVQNNNNKIPCASCTEILNSDTDDDDKRNIGCDFCDRWYHKKCTEFSSISYDMAATNDYKCNQCK